MIKYHIKRGIQLLMYIFVKLIYTLFPLKCMESIKHVLRMAVWRVKLKSIGKDTEIYQYVVINHPEDVMIGDNVAIAEFVHMWGGGQIAIGDNTIIGAHAIITSLTHDASTSEYRHSLLKKEVKIGNNVWIGTGSIILPGLVIGDNAIVGAGSVVTRSVESNTIVVGVPARPLRKV